MQRTVFVHFAVVLHDCNVKRSLFLVTFFMEEITYVFSLIFFSLPLIFTLVANSISHFLTNTSKFSCCSSNNKSILCFFISRSSSLSLSVFSLGFAGLSPTFSFSLSFSFSIFQICGHVVSSLWTCQLTKA